MNFNFGMLLAFCFLVVGANAQDGKPAKDWFLQSPTNGKYQGVSINEAYSTILKGKKSTPVIVAVIDSGVDFDHEDLKDVMWVNKDEVPNNGIDDDKNGYVDDVHGWNFIGGTNGKEIDKDSYEVARVFTKYDKLFNGKTSEMIKGKEAKRNFAQYIRAKEDLEKNIGEKTEQVALYGGIVKAIGFVQNAMKKNDFTLEDLNNYEVKDEKIQGSIEILKNILGNNPNVGEVKAGLEDYVDFLDGSLKYGYNPDFDPRPSIVGDNYANSYEKGYGNNTYDGPDASHGTHVAGIIAATRGNGVGMDGVADNVQIMTVRAVPDGDERDKDVANAIIYAVDNGAQVINMSFGKGFKWDKKAVDAAMKYAEKKDVLLVHAAGNSHQNNDNSFNFPNDTYEKKKLFGTKQSKVWLEVGALDWKGDKNSAATFSNYGKTNVDVFAPGVDIYSTTPDNNYEFFQGTSMASPVVAGVAATLRSYYPDLTAKQVKNIIMASVDPIQGKVIKPGTEDEVPFSELAVSGGSINAKKAIQLAEKTKGKKKSVKRTDKMGPKA